MLLMLDVFVAWVMLGVGGILAEEAREGEGSRVRRVICRREGVS